MSTISVAQEHNKSITEIRELVEGLARKLDERYQIHHRWVGERKVALSRGGLDGLLEFDESQVTINIKLGFMMGAFKSKIQSEVERVMREKLV